MALKPIESFVKSDSKFTMNNNIPRPFSEPPPYPGTTTRASYSHMPNSTMNKFGSSRTDTKPAVAPGGIPGVPVTSLEQQRKPYIPLGEIRRNIPTNQIRPAPAGQQQQQVLIPNPGPSSYQSLPAFNQQISQINLRPVATKDDGDEETSTHMTEEELMMLSVPVLARRLLEAQNRIATQATEIKGKDIIHAPLGHNIFI
jgi:hypothetical protein